MHRLIIIIFFFNLRLVAQELTYSKADSLSFDLYNKQEYKQLIDLGKEALSKDIDFFYLRLRLGIAYYYTENYENAVFHLEKAQQMFPSNNTMQEYLFFSYLYSNRIFELNLLYNSLNQPLKEKLKPFLKKNNSLALNFGIISSQNFQKNGNIDINGSEDIYGESIYNNNLNLTGFTFNRILNKNTNIFAATNIFKTFSVGRVQTDNNNFTQEFENLNYQFNLGIDKQYKSFTYTVFGGFFYQNLDILTANFDTQNQEYKILPQENVLRNIVLGIQVSRRFKKINPSFSVSYSNFIKSNQLQTETSVTYYPTGNLNLYAISTLNAFFSKTTDKTLFNQKFGIKTFDFLWIETGFSIGNHHNFVTNKAVLTYNTADPTLFSAGIEFMFLYKNFLIKPSYRFNTKQGSYLQFADQNNSQILNFNYSNHLFYNTLIWNF